MFFLLPTSSIINLKQVIFKKNVSKTIEEFAAIRDQIYIFFVILRKLNFPEGIVQLARSICYFEK